jgi:beta-lactamase regulating signal transducer with metallopeptidase domain
MIAELMDRFVEFSSTWLQLIMLATWRAVPILVVVIGLGLAFRRKLTPSLQALLLTIVVARLLLPISIGTPLSLHKPIEFWFSSSVGESVDTTEARPFQDHKYSFLPNVDQSSAQSPSAPTQWQSPIPFNFTTEGVAFTALMSVVISVTLGLLFRSLFSHLRFALSLRSCRLLNDQRLIDLVLRECDSLFVGRRPTLREVPSLTAPAVFGLFRQTVCLPPGLTETLNEQELRWIIRHELAHIRRRDIPVTIVASIAGAFHWFNPAVWMIVGRLRTSMEAAADRLALQDLTNHEISAYGELLLRFAQNSTASKSSPTIGLISFASGRHLKQRVELLLRDHKPSRLSTKCLSVGLVGTIAFAGLTDAKETIDVDMPEVHLVSTDPTLLPIQPSSLASKDEQELTGPVFVETYDVTSILEKVPASLKSEKKSTLEQLTSFIPLQPGMKDKLRVDGKTLSAELTASQHQSLKQTLDIWKDGEPGQILIEARFIQTTNKTASSIDWTERRIDGLAVSGLGPAIAARIKESELADLIRSVSADVKGNILMAPRVTLFNGQTASIADQVRRPFVTGVDPKADGRMQPVISVVDEGLSFELTPKAGDDNSITLAFKVKTSSIGKVSYANLPIKASNSAEPNFTVQVPATEQYEVSSSVNLAVGESVVVAIPRVYSNEPGADTETTMIVALTPRILDKRE